MLPFERRTYYLPEPTEVWFFNDDRKFLAHVQDHFVKTDELWDRLFAGGRPFLVQVERVLGGKAGKFLLDPRQKWTDEEVSLLKEVYRRVLPLLEDGVRFSAELPLYARYLCKAISRETGTTVVVKEICCLSRWGFAIFIQENVVRTAYFPPITLKETEKEDYVNVFRECVRAVRQMLSDPGHFDSKYQQQKTYENVKFFSEPNWILLPNPRPRARVGSPRDIGAKDSRKDWLAGCQVIRPTHSTR